MYMIVHVYTSKYYDIIIDGIFVIPTIYVYCFVNITVVCRIISNHLQQEPSYSWLHAIHACFLIRRRSQSTASCLQGLLAPKAIVVVDTTPHKAMSRFVRGGGRW